MDLSVHPLVKIACGGLNSGPLEFDYELANSRVSLQDAVLRLSKNPQIAHVYLAFHGARNSLECFNGDKVKIDNLVALFAPTSFEGVHLGVCQVGNKKNLQKMLDRTKLRWASGYSAQIDWVGSAALDMQFIYELVGSTRRKREMIIGDAADALKRHAAGACKDLGLSVLVRGSEEVAANLMDAQ
ncbi:hypothetical protein [Mesorhizobium sp.]|uniref:hypothetical protein n=1 Tax=Mesorhizobium sp. TaxID=1871066 RepID=UPI000FE79931|nr:hypothetical protein [Mesorhizobium sp.]RWK41711.1 MAG: hypothetical protein EOR46_15570 [Mesorhizobium sp.]RWK71070.1 MAG: hypothetical protein EOR54_02830 [Mesorhizobium sp.]RWK76078.1 MAG: hypothetical protein EOR50_15655 [Mesorhizobium sp.]RWK84448.1 MAG: hypothetical protein EOR51_02290 [Mesorhizobium sp.]RWL05059.1 MAG: hypothetical protein EOR55_14075 [Mesorhizobium sp.]